MPRLLHELAVGRGDGSYTRLLTRLAKLDLLAIDDWMLAPLRDAERRDLTEVIEDRVWRQLLLPLVLPHSRMLPGCLKRIVPMVFGWERRPARRRGHLEPLSARN